MAQIVHFGPFWAIKLRNSFFGKDGHTDHAVAWPRLVSI